MLKQKFYALLLSSGFLISSNIANASIVKDNQCITDLYQVISGKYDSQFGNFSGPLKISTISPWGPEHGNAVINILYPDIQFGCAEDSFSSLSCNYGTSNTQITDCQLANGIYTISMTGSSLGSQASVTLQIPATPSPEKEITVVSMNSAIPGLEPNTDTNEKFKPFSW